MAYQTYLTLIIPALVAFAITVVSTRFVMDYLYGAGVVAEDHNIIGGLGSAIMEAAAENAPVPIARIGLRDRFPGSGSPDALLDRYGMGVNDIVEAAVATIARKTKQS